MGERNRAGAFSRREMLAAACALGVACVGSRALAAGTSASRDGETRGVASSTSDAASSSAGERAAAGVPREVADDLGRTVRVESLERVVACMGSFARVWQLAGGELAGVSSDALTDYPELGLSADTTTVGDFSAINLEQLVALEPTLVIMSGASGGRGGTGSQTDLQQSLEDMGIPVLYFKVTTFDDYLRMLRACCDLTGRDDRYDESGAQVRERVDAVVADAQKKLAARGSAPSVALMTTYSGGTRVQASSTMTGSMLAELGAANIADEDKSLLSDYSVEALIARDPDAIFVVPMGNDEESAAKALAEQTADDPAWAGLTAVAEGRFFTLDPRLFQYKPLDRWDEAYQALADDLYGADGR